MATTIDDLLSEARRGKTIGDSVIALIAKLVAENDPAKRQALFDELKANHDRVETEVLANTPQEP